jgi:hypothetical protein
MAIDTGRLDPDYFARKEIDDASSRREIVHESCCLLGIQGGHHGLPGNFLGVFSDDRPSPSY